ncbi:VanZ family protein [Chitinolyticbacter albus]|uniref:VanZ family protein n=1 Tax=Chitinolyticbacter albus TaxID=2961951 RepID=UPI00210BA212|nr:VanZ family protein [Chitinolyticbacter albus]
MRSFPPVSYLAREAPQTRIARYFLACYLLVVLVLSFYPFTGWHYNGEPVLAFYSYPLPYYITFFDNFANVLAYVPVGLGIALLLRRRLLSLLLGVLGGIALSALVEFVQQFLPDRVASNMDILANGTGALIGVVLAQFVASRRWQRRWLVFRHSYLVVGRRGEWGLVWLGLWFISQCDPSVPLFGVVVEPVALPQPFISPIANARLFLDLLEGCGVLLHVFGLGMFVSVLVRHQRHVPRVMVVTLVAGIVLKLVFAGMLLKPDQFFAWINLNVVIGAGLAWLLLALCAHLRRRLRALFGAWALIAVLIVAWLWPLAPQLSASLEMFRWRYGHLQHFSGMAAMVGDIWPYGAIALMLALVVRHAED